MNDVATQAEQERTEVGRALDQLLEVVEQIVTRVKELGLDIEGDPA